MPRTVLITGATDGLGRKVAQGLATAGDHVILHGRSQNRLTETAHEIEAATGRLPETVVGDWSRLDDVRSVADQVREITGQLDVLVNNAGIGTGEPDGHERRESRDGHELRFAINYLAPYTLTLDLLPLLQESAAPRIVNVASDGQLPIDFDNLMLTTGYSGEQAYCQSKLALVAFGFSLAETAGRVTVNSVHPGSFMPTKIVFGSGDNVVQDLEGGIDAVQYLASAPELSSVTGRYFVRRREAQAHDMAYDEETRTRLLDVTAALTGIRLPVTSN